MIRLPPIPTRGRIRVKLLDEVEARLPLCGGVTSAHVADGMTACCSRATVRAALLQLRREGRADFTGEMGMRRWWRITAQQRHGRRNTVLEHEDQMTDAPKLLQHKFDVMMRDQKSAPTMPALIVAGRLFAAGVSKS